MVPSDPHHVAQITQLLRLQINDTQARLREPLHRGGTWQTENLQLQWHSLAAQVIADISNILSAKQQICKMMHFYKPSVLFSTPNNQNKLTVQLNDRVDVV